MNQKIVMVSVGLTHYTMDISNYRTKLGDTLVVGLNSDEWLFKKEQ